MDRGAWQAMFHRVTKIGHHWSDLPCRQHDTLLLRWLSGKESACQHRETWVLSLGQEFPLEKKMAKCSSIVALKIPWIEELLGCSPWGHSWAGMHARTHAHTHTHTHTHTHIQHSMVLRIMARRRHSVPGGGHGNPPSILARRIWWTEEPGGYNP